MSKKVLVIGGVAGGASAAARIRRLDENAEIIMFERGPHVSFSNCSLPFHLSGIVPDSDRLIIMDPVKFKSRYNIEARTNQEVVQINRNEKSISINNLLTNEMYKESYDYLILSPGAQPIIPPIAGVNLPHVFTVRNVDDIEKLQHYLTVNKVNNVAVIGGGFIGVEVAENLRLANHNVTLVEFAKQIMMPFDEDMAQILHKEMMDQGVELILNDGLRNIDKDKITLNSTKEVIADVVVLAIGVRPETTLAKKAGLELGELGAIKVNQNYLTNDPAIYAVGDAIEVHHQILRKPARLALAGPAQRQARAAADHIYGIPHHNKGVIGSSSIQIFDLNCASTGLNVKAARDAGLKVDSVYMIANDKVNLMPNSNPLHLKLIFEIPTGKIIGAQAIGKGNSDKRIDVIATSITMGATLEDLKELELTYSPMFSTAKDVVNLAALVGLNILYGRYEQIQVTEVRNLVENDAYIIDVREENEFANGHIKGAKNIPLSQFRERISEVPTDVPVYLHCRSAQRSYHAVMALQGNGYTNVKNIAGSFLGICLYEYFHDVTQQRKPIVTNYNFN